MKNNAISPNNALTISNFLFSPHGLILFFLIRKFVMTMLIIDLEKMISEIGIRPLMYFIQTVIMLNENALNIKKRKPFDSFLRFII